MPGFLLLVAKNNYFWSREYKDLDFIANGDVARVVKVRNTREMYGFRFADVALYFPDYDVEIESKIILDTLMSDAPSLTVEMNNRLFMNVLVIKLKEDNGRMYLWIWGIYVPKGLNWISFDGFIQRLPGLRSIFI